MEPEILQFASSIGANEPTKGDEIYGAYRSIFRERNYFRHPSGFLVIKLSRSKKPFWGLTREIIGFLNSHSSLQPNSASVRYSGWVFSKEETVRNIDTRHWNLDSAGQQYKINMPLPDSNMFFGPRDCQKKLGVE